MKRRKLMKVQYLVEIANPERHIVKVTIKLSRPVTRERLSFFLPSWSPGSYLMREYSRHIRYFEASLANGESLYFEQTQKGVWIVDWKRSQVNSQTLDFQVSYEIYCKELTVRTSHVDESHAFLHGPSYLMGILEEQIILPQIEFRFPPIWSKLSTALCDISKSRDRFVYEAKNYDELIDTPVEIGCQETDGFELFSKAHHLAFYGEVYPHHQDLKGDFKKIVATVASHFKNELPYDQYLFITHFSPKLYGGLEHLNSTALHFDGRKLGNRKDYLNYLSLVAHEYFHLWNVKRIRPQELGPFDYLNENYTSMLWLAEGLTSFMDDLFVYRAGISTLEEYLEAIKGNLEVYYSTPGRKFHSLEQSSFNAWIKLYRPDENSKNSSISYYLKGGLVFMKLHSLLKKSGKGVDDLLDLLWVDFKQRPERGISKVEFYKLINQLGGKDVLDEFTEMIETTKEIDFESCLNSFGLEIKWQQSTQPWLGVEWEFVGDRVFVKSVALDSPGYRSGLNSGDEILFLNGLRFLKEDTDKMAQYLLIDRPYEVLVSRLGKMKGLSVIPEIGPRVIKEIGIVNRSLAEDSFRYLKI